MGGGEVGGRGRQAWLGSVLDGSPLRVGALLLTRLGPHHLQACPCSQIPASGQGVCVSGSPLSLLPHPPSPPHPAAHSLWEDTEGQLGH